MSISLAMTDQDKLNDARVEIESLRASLKKVEQQRDDLSGTVAGVVHALRLNPLNGIVNQCEHLRDELDELRTERASLRDDVARIGQERDLMIVANVELQTRLSACISALEFGEFVVLNSQRYLPGATGIERDAGKFLDRCEAMLHAQDDK